MREIDRWCENKPKHIALLAQTVFTSANELFEYLQAVKSGDFYVTRSKTADRQHYT